MSARTIRVLHVEDDELQRRMLRAQLATLPDYAFALTCVASEDGAMEAFRGGYDLVLLDYHLTQGNGLNCLRRLRQLDTSVPIIAISGKATPEVAADLLEAGADDYFSKDGLEPEALGRSIRAALARADAWRSRASDSDPDRTAEIGKLFQEICTAFAAHVGPDFLTRLDRLEREARAARLTFAQTLRLFETACEKIDTDGRPGVAKKLLRPIMLEIVLRLFEEAPARA